MSKLIACKLIAPALQLDEPLKLVCREGRLSNLMADLAVHRLDLIIADREIVKVDDLSKITEMGVLMTPALAIDGKVKASGRVLSVEAIKGLLESK